VTHPLLRATGVGVRHDGHAGHTPAAVDLEVRAGEVVLLLGPSGSGKSTFALTVNGLVPQLIPGELRGTIELGGRDTAEQRVPRLATEVGMVFQDADAGVIAGTVLDEVCFGPENQLRPVAEVLERAAAALRVVGLWERRDEDPGRLSGGGRQRLAIACALALGAPLLVLDEPTANLDPAGAAEVYAALREVVADGTRGVLLIEHDLDQCVDLVDRVVVLDGRGRVVMTGPTREVLAGRAAELHALGVWLPVATLAGLRLREAGLPVESLPLEPGELTALLAGLPEGEGPGGPQVVAEPAATAPAAAPMIEVRGLTVTRGGRRILDGIDLKVRRGEFLAVIGTNGAGKTTLLQAIAGVVPPPRGAVTVAGLDPARADARRLASRIGFVFQNPEHQFIRATVAAELAHALELQRRPTEEIAARVDEMLERFGLTSHREVHPFLLSGGQKRRLSVGTALVGGAEVLALDEPTFGQDRARAAELLGLLGELHAEGTTIVVVTHDLQLVAEHASHAAVLVDGRLIAHDRTEEVLRGELLERAGLRLPPLAEATRALPAGSPWHGVTRIADLPGTAA